MREIWGEGGRRKRAKSLSSRASSDFDLEEAEAEENYILISDENVRRGLGGDSDNGGEG